MKRHARILLAAGDLASSAAVGGALEAAHHVVRLCEPSAVAQQAAGFRPDVVIMDLPSSDPIGIAAAVRRAQSAYRPLVLCVLDDGPGQRMPALEAGADACIERPFTPEELVLYVYALLRRAPWVERTVHNVGQLVIDLTAHTAHYEDRQLSLTAREFEIISVLAEYSGVVLSKQALLESIWGYDVSDENLVEVHVSALRRRLPTEAREMIHTVRGVGYVLRDVIPQGDDA